jgi:hypothetical protein
MEIMMKMKPIPADDKNPNRTLSDWLSMNGDSYTIHAIVFCKEKTGSSYWHIYYIKVIKKTTVE